MRLPLMVAALTLCLAAPAKAGLITLEVIGVVTESYLSGYMGPIGEPPPAWYIPTTPPAVGSTWSLFVEIETDPGEYPVLPFAAFNIGGFTGGSSPCNGCRAAALSPLSAAELSLYGSPIRNAQGVSLISTHFIATLNPGWQSGSFSSFIETVNETGYVSGKVTHVRSTVSVSVPEPATALMLGLGAIAVALRRRARWPHAGVGRSFLKT